jgi:hypothetical protein
MVKQIFYIVGVVVLMIIAYRLMKKVEPSSYRDPYEIPEDMNEDFFSDSEEVENSEKSDDTER